MDELNQLCNNIDRRRFLQLGAAGLGGMAFAGMSAASSNVSEVKQSLPHHAPKAKRVIYLFQAGAPSQVDLFDHKPALAKHHGQDIFSLIEQKGRLTGFNNTHKTHPIINTKYKFEKHGDNGGSFSNLLPHMASISDGWCRLGAVSTTPVSR